MKRVHFELILSLVAAIASSVAAIGASFTGFYQMQAVNLERIPAIHLACRPEYRLAEKAAHISEPEETLLLRPSGAEWIHVGGTDPMGMPLGPVATPEPFARCTVKNFGRLPLLDMHLPTRLTFRNPATGAITRSTIALDLPGLSADAEYDFSLLNGSNDVMGIVFDRTVFLADIDGNGQVSERLFVDARVPEIERMTVEPQKPPATRPTGTTVSITDFAYRPRVLRVRARTLVTFVNTDGEAHTVTSVSGAFDSGTIDSGHRWQHVFARPGRYLFRCLYHPYMAGEIDVVH
jgi:plastocyanin